jgi:probable HAF family extracellular repeat protein
MRHERRRTNRALMATAMALVAGIATPAAASAETSGGAAERGGAEPSRITVTEIQATAGEGAVLHSVSEISNRGQVLLTVDSGGEGADAERSVAVWHEGETDLLWPGHSYSEVDMSEQGHVVGVAPAAGCETSPSAPDCVQPVLWVDGERRRLPFGAAVASATVRVSDRGYVAAELQRHDPAAPDGVAYELVAWRGRSRDEVVRAPVTGRHVPTAINDRGQVALWRLNSQPDEPLTCAALWSVGGSVTELGACRQPSLREYAEDINRHGQVLGGAGYSIPLHSFVWDDGRRIEVPGVALQDLNDQGDAVGQTTPPFLLGRAVLWRDGRAVDLGTLGRTYGIALAINERGQAVGSSTTADGESHAVLWQDGQVIDLGALAGAERWSTAVDINDRGQILGEVDGRPAVWPVHRR